MKDLLPKVTHRKNHFHSCDHVMIWKGNLILTKFSDFLLLLLLGLLALLGLLGLALLGLGLALGFAFGLALDGLPLLSMCVASEIHCALFVLNVPSLVLARFPM